MKYIYSNHGVNISSSCKLMSSLHCPPLNGTKDIEILIKVEDNGTTACWDQTCRGSARLLAGENTN